MMMPPSFKTDMQKSEAGCLVVADSARRTLAGDGGNDRRRYPLLHQQVVTKKKGYAVETIDGLVGLRTV